MKKNDYSEKLKDPRWQKKRLEIMQRDGFTCQQCGNNESMLCVHHRLYIKNAEPWDYPNEYLITLCEICHDAELSMNDDLMSLNNELRKTFFSSQIIELTKAINESRLCHLPEVVMSAICHAIKNNEQQQKMVNDYFDYLKHKFNLGKSNG